MKILHVFVLLFLFVNGNVQSQAYNFTVSPASSCYNGSVHSVTAAITATAPLANLYTWSITTNTCSPSYSLAVPNGSIIHISIPCAGIFSITAFATQNGTYVVGNALQTVAINQNTISLSANAIPSATPACTGTTFSLNMSGAPSYTITGASVNNGTFIPQSNGCFTVNASNGTSCTASITTCYSVVPIPNIVVSGPSHCLTGSTTLTASGANNYTWQPGNLTGSVVVLNPAVNTCYTITGINANGCTQTIQHCLTVGLGLNVSILNSPGMICAGNSATFNAVGALNYTWQPGGMTSPSIVISPTATTCYSVFGSNAPGCNGSASTCLTVSLLPSLTLAPSATYCPGTSLTLVAGGALSYTWFPSNLNSMSISVSPSVNTCYTVQGSNAAGCISSETTCVLAAANPSVGLFASIVPLSSPACTGTTFSATVIGLTNYTWSGASVSNGTFIPLSTGCLTLSGTNAQGCFASNVTCFNVLPASPISVSSNSLFCPGYSVTLFANGAITFTWFPGSIISPSIIVTPSASTCYSISGTNTWGCVNSSTFCINMLSLTPVSISGNSIICQGDLAYLTASGALFYNWSNGFNTPNTAVAPSVNTCYTVVGLAANGCSSTAVQCVSVLPTPSMSIIGTPTVCWGSSITMTAFGASSYTWSTIPPVPTNTLFDIPYAGINWYSVAGTGTNGCSSGASYSVFSNTNCAIVWPGDANRDGVVSNTDILELGLAANISGAARSNTSIAWSGQYANSWGGTISNGWDLAHADCNGDGVIDASDSIAITQNFALTHSFREYHSASTNPDIHLVASAEPIFAGTWNKADIHLGDANNSISQVYGIAYEIVFDQGLVQTDSVKVIYTSSFLNASNQNIDFGKVVFANSKLYAATVRIDHGDVSGYGKIGEFWYKVSNTAALNSVLNLSITNAIKINSAGVTGIMNAGSASVAISNSGVGLNEISLLGNSVLIYPNPTAHLLTLQNNTASDVTYTFTDVLGREVLKGEFVGIKTLDVSSLGQGAYFIQFEGAGISVHKKLIIEKR